jgi:HD-like signal output (HDOD) protein
MSIRQNLNALYLKLFKKKAVQPIVNNLGINSAPTVKPALENKVVLREKVNIPVAFLKTLNPISELLSDSEIGQLQVTATNFTPNSVIFNKGARSDSFVYVVKGTVHLETNIDSSQEIDSGSDNALYPLSVGKLHNMTATAKSEAMVIYIPQSILMQIPIAPPLENKPSIPDNLKKIPFFNDFYQQILQGNLKTPSLPNVALKLNQAVQQGCGLAEITKIVNLDPVIAAKLIQVVNSPLYRLPQPITSNFNAVNRLGLQTTRNLVTAFSMQNLIKCEKPLVKTRLKTNWMQSIKVSSICYILAQLTQKIDPNEALLAGLLHNIGALPILVFADSLPENTYQPTDIDLCIEEMQGQIGSIILEKWEFPEELKKIPLQSKNWFENNSDGLSQIDIVLLAKYHYMLTHSGNAKLPLITTLPAFQKLSNQQLTPEMSLQIIQDSQQQIAEVLKFFMH